MRKFLFGDMLVTMMVLCMMVVGISSCNGCKEETGNSAVSADYDGVVQDFTAGVEHITALHKQKMYDLYKGENYAWYETRILFNDSIRLEALDDLHVTDVTNIFQLFDPARSQTISTDIKKGTIVPKPIYDIWIEDVDMSKSPIKLTVKDVLEKLKTWDGILPPAISITLRQPLGPRRCNPQYVIGNIMDVIFVDAVTGDITNWCPAFPIPGVQGPLGEWP